MKIIVDAMGGDNAPDEIVKGAVLAAEQHGIEIILTGNGEEILRSIQAMGRKDIPAGIELAGASEIITMEDDPVTAIRTKKDSSLVVGLKMLSEGEGDALVSAGNTGALLSGATLIVKRVKGIRRASLAPHIPTGEGGMLLIDGGANVECTPEYLMQFAYMGSYYAEAMMNKPNPRVALLNNGTERSKGTQLQTAAYELMEEAGKSGAINFVGNLEAKDAMFGGCDVLVTDGFTGNIMLKAIEGAFLYMFSEIKTVLKKSTKTKLGAVLLKNDLKSMKDSFSADGVGGTMLLGITKPVIKAHGSANAQTMLNAIRQAVTTVESGISDNLRQKIESMKFDETAG